MERIVPSARERVFLNPVKWAPPFPALEELHFQCYKHQRQHIFKYLSERYTSNRYAHFAADLNVSAPKCGRWVFEVGFMGNSGVNLASLGKWGRWLAGVVDEVELGVEEPKWGVKEEEGSEGEADVNVGKGKGKEKQKEEKKKPNALANMVKAHPNVSMAKRLPNAQGIHPDGYDPSLDAPLITPETYDPLKPTDPTQLAKGMPYGTRVKEIIIDGRMKRRYNTFKYMKRRERQAREEMVMNLVRGGMDIVQAQAQVLAQMQARNTRTAEGDADGDVDMDQAGDAAGAESEDEEHTFNRNSDDDDSSDDGGQDGYTDLNLHLNFNDDRDFDYAANKAFDPTFKRWKLEGKGMREALIIRVRRWSTFKEPVEGEEAEGEKEKDFERKLKGKGKGKMVVGPSSSLSQQPAIRPPYSKYDPPPPAVHPLIDDPSFPLALAEMSKKAKKPHRRNRGKNKQQKEELGEANKPDEKDKPKRRKRGKNKGEKREEQVIATRDVVIKVYASEWLDSRTNNYEGYVTQLVVSASSCVQVKSKSHG